jgi:hypothetical protein
MKHEILRRFQAAGKPPLTSMIEIINPKFISSIATAFRGAR